MQEIHVANAAGSCSTWCDRIGRGHRDCAGRSQGQVAVLDAGAGQLVDLHLYREHPR
ncbi:hypothetical protein ACCQ07_21540 (plasmid) [Xanthomonas sp. NCPPB 3583]|uniref:hypothetical protein n=1 Tax=Xanthomonas sp. NCPPB 3583 TaxID=487558 RepID=UPI0035590D7B